MDLIERQAAIDAISVGKELLSRVLDDIDFVGTDREKYSWGLRLIEANINDIRELPSAQPEVLACGEGVLNAQPEIIRCKDCKYWQDQQEGVVEVPICARPENKYEKLPFRFIIGEDGFCSFAKRRTDDV